MILKFCICLEAQFTKILLIQAALPGTLIEDQTEKIRIFGK
jgi:hypothetical protein